MGAWGPQDRRPADSRCSCRTCSAANLGSLADQPWVAALVASRVVGVEVDEAALDLEVADLEDVAPASGAPFWDARAPRAVLVLAVRGPLGDDRVAPGEDPVEVRVVVPDGLQPRADVPEHLPDLLAPVGDPPLREHHLGVGGEQLEDAVPGRRHAGVVERLQVLERDRLALLVGHRLRRYCHACSSSRTGSRCAALAARYANAMIGPSVAPPAQ